MIEFIGFSTEEIIALWVLLGIYVLGALINLIIQTRDKNEGEIKSAIGFLLLSVTIVPPVLTTLFVLCIVGICIIGSFFLEWVPAFFIWLFKKVTQ